jgi:carbon-monoxide dehydrogenase large subunit
MIGGSAVYAASNELRQKLLNVAGSMLEVASEDLESAHGRIFVRGSDQRRVSLRAVVDEIYRHTFGAHADEIEPGLEATRYFRAGNIYHQPDTQGRFSTYPTWSNGTAACIVEVDADTGLVRVVQYCLVSDSGLIINPVLADANLHGSIAQGIGGGLYERLAYDKDGQLMTGTFMDYTLPTAVELPRFEIEHQVTPTPFTALGTKGVGESGITGPLAALCGAVEDALLDLDVRLDQVPLTPSVVWRAINEARARRAALFQR